MELRTVMLMLCHGKLRGNNGKIFTQNHSHRNSDDGRPAALQSKNYGKE